ncbi:Aldose 1-epimerase [termite gut metagenome]|uniref:Aldose 1-epimerase n=1 Tax=termite gut metagenome TaxID=433724 RepID=A0A5J4STG5_9ZZZZ
MNKSNFILIISILFLLCFCTSDKLTLSGLKISDFHTKTKNGVTDMYVLKNKQNMEVCITNYGGRVVSIMVPDRNGKFEDVVYGFSTIDDYLNTRQNFGAIVGRYIGRIAKATFTLDSVTYHLEANSGEDSMHGGTSSFAYKIWEAEQPDESTLNLSYLSIGGENGFPGNLTVKVTYHVTDNNELDINYEAETDQPTIVNLANHSFFNISGDLNSSVESQLLYINADSYTPIDSMKRATGEIFPIAGTIFDFTTQRLMGERINEDSLKATGGYDHNWVLSSNGDVEKLAARVTDKQSGRTLEVYTTEPGIQIYTGNQLNKAIVGKNSIAYSKRSAICLETQHFPDSPNKINFSSPVLRPGETYHSRCIYRFGIEE